MDSGKQETDNFFSQYGLEVVKENLEVGKTYPIFGAITRFCSEEIGDVRVELNYYITIIMRVPDQERLNLLKEHAFETGIFVAKVVSNSPIELECHTVIFGKRQGFNA